MRSAGENAGSRFCLQDVVDSLSNLKTRIPTGIVSVEHSFQPWTGFRTLLEVANSSGSNVRLCYDPCNLWLAGDGEEANEITASLPVDWLSMVHLKQRVGNLVSPRLEPGEVNLPRQLNLLNDAQYTGPFLFETTPSEEVWKCLRDSRLYLASIVHELVSVADHRELQIDTVSQQLNWADNVAHVRNGNESTNDTSTEDVEHDLFFAAIGMKSFVSWLG